MQELADNFEIRSLEKTKRNIIVLTNQKDVNKSLQKESLKRLHD